MAGRRPFGSVRRRASGRHQATFWHDGKLHHAPKTFKTRADANAYLSTVHADILRGTWHDPAGQKITVDELGKDWLAHDPSKRASTLARDEAILRLHVYPTLGKRRIGLVTKADIQKLASSWATEVAPRTARRQHQTVAAMFAFAVANEWLERTPCRDIDLPEIPRLRRHPLGPDEVKAIAAAVDLRYAAMVWVAAVLGLRFGEVAGLTIGSLRQFLNGEVHVTAQLGRDGRLAPPKSEAGERVLTMPRGLREILAAHLSAENLSLDDPPDRLVFTGPQGGPIDYAHWRSRVWIPAVKAAGLPNATFHDLRRAAATALVVQRVDMKTAQTRLGHSDPRLTFGLYAQATTDADRKAARDLNRHYFGKASRPLRAQSSGEKAG